jgi:F-type H+-transporting ATPase subunit b
MAEFIAELVGFVLMVLVIWRYVVPLLRNMIKSRQEAVQVQVDEAEAAAARYREAEARLESAIADARSEAARIRDDARADSSRIKEELTEQAGREVERIRQRGEEQLGSQRDQVVRRLRAELGGMSMDLAERLVVQRLSDEASRSASVDDFLDGIEGLAAPAGQDRPAHPVGPVAGKVTN